MSVRIYIADYCAYCDAAKRLIESKGVEYETVDVTHDLEKRRWLQEVTGQRTVPQIFAGDRSLGGYSDIVQLDRRGELDAILK